MKTIASVQFEPEEIEVFVRAMAGHEHHIQIKQETGLRFPVRTYLNQLRQEEMFDLRALEDLGDVLDELIHDWQAEVTPEQWRALGAPGADDAVEGLAQERRFAIDRAVAARVLVADALKAVCLASPERRVTRTERRSVTA